jgi:hypothetical protein
VVFLVLLGLHSALYAGLLLFMERGASRRWSVAELTVLAVCAPLLVLGFAVLDGGWATAARVVGLVGGWLLLFSRFSYLLMGTPTGEHTVAGVIAEIEGLYAGAGDAEGAAVVRERRDALAAARTDEERSVALRGIEGLATSGNGRFSDRYTGSSPADSRLSELWPVLHELAARQGPRPRV